MSGKVATKLFIGNLPDFCRREDLLEKFEKFGNVVEFDIVSNYGFAHFEKPEEAQAAADALNGATYNGNNLRVEMSHSKVRQKPGMGDREGCYRCGKEGHWSKDCPRGPRRPKRDYRDDPYEDDPYYRDPYDDPYYRSRYLPPPPSYRRYDPYYDPYDRRPLPSRDPYMRERLSDPYARVDPYYYARRSPPPSSAAASARDPYSKDPYASARAAESRDPYDDYMDRRRAYSAATQPSAYSRSATGSSSGSYAVSASSSYPAGASSSYSAAPGYSSGTSSGYHSSSTAAAYSSSAPSSGYSSGSSSKYTSSAVQSSRVPGPY